LSSDILVGTSLIALAAALLWIAIPEKNGIKTKSLRVKRQAQRFLKWREKQRPKPV